MLSLYDTMLRGCGVRWAVLARAGIMQQRDPQPEVPPVPLRRVWRLQNARAAIGYIKPLSEGVSRGYAARF